MKYLKKPWVKLTILVLLIASLFYLPTREFLKITGILGMPFVFVAGFMNKQTKRSLKWNMAALCLVVLGGGYVYSMIQLPERIEIRRITAHGSVLIQEGQYDSAIAEYSKLEKLGKTDKMKAKIEDAERAKKGQRDIELARQLIKKGDYDEARKLIEAIPRKTNAASEAAKILKSIPDGDK